MEEHVKEYNSLIEESPFFQEMARQVELRAAQEMLTIVAEARFPSLSELAQQRIPLAEDMATLDQLMRQLVLAPDETVAKEVLNKLANK